VFHLIGWGLGHIFKGNFLHRKSIGHRHYHICKINSLQHLD
jgi:hypothetical protein